MQVRAAHEVREAWELRSRDVVVHRAYDDGPVVAFHSPLDGGTLSCSLCEVKRPVRLAPRRPRRLRLA